jgi:hypothetical protein
MYNIHSHYETIFHSLNSIVTHRRAIYLHPYGTTQPENIERITDNLSNVPNITDPMFIFYDQEPILGQYNYRLFDHIRDNMKGPFILVTTEKSSGPLDEIAARYGWPTVYYFHHAFAAHDWFRGYRYDSQLISPEKRVLKKKYISFNRLTSSHRVYRSLLISELFKRDILDQGYVSYNDSCPDGGTYKSNIQQAIDDKLIPEEVGVKAIMNISRVNMPLRIDYQDQQFIPNHSFVLSAVPQTQESFCYLVTETCFWQPKHHLTEKIFKPIVSRMPFVLAGPAHNLKYLREYGFKTFDKWFDESYDDIEDPIMRLKAISKTMDKICSYSLSELQDMLVDMQPVLEHNYQRFYSNEFLDQCWNELQTNLRAVI